MEEERMPKVNVSKDSLRLTASDLYHMKQVEEVNFKRVQKLKQFRYRSRIIGSLLGATAIAIYTYTINAVKQETFLDDFEEPAKVSDEQ